MTVLKDGGMVFEASDLGLRPGQWPQSIRLPDGLVATLVRIEHDAEGDVIAGYYRVGGRSVTVFND